MTPTRYCLTLGTAALALAAAIAGFNYAVDPYLLFDADRVAGFNDVKPAAATRERMMKAYQLERLDANTIVIGSSRPDLGIDPASPAWPKSAQPVYNMGLVGGGVPEGLQYLRHYVALHPGHAPQTLVVGLDFENDLYVPLATPAPARAAGEVEERLAVDAQDRPNPARALRVWKDRAQGLLSLDALLDSVATIRSNPSDVMMNLERNGRLTEAAMDDVARADGYERVFNHTNLATVKLLGKPHRVLSDTPAAPIRRLATVQAVLDFAKQHGSDVVLMIQPAHVSRLELLDRMGYWDDYDRWKRALAAMAAQAASSQRVALWDFAGYEAQMQEAAPAKGKGRMEWFWDQLHYKSRLGNVMLARMFAPAPAAASVDRFGVLLTPDNIDARLAQVRRDRDAFRSAMPREAARLARMACGTDGCPAPAPRLALAH